MGLLKMALVCATAGIDEHSNPVAAAPSTNIRSLSLFRLLITISSDQFSHPAAIEASRRQHAVFLRTTLLIVVRVGPGVPVLRVASEIQVVTNFAVERSEQKPKFH